MCFSLLMCFQNPSYASKGEEHDQFLEHVLFGETWEKGLQGQDVQQAIEALESASYLTLDHTKDNDKKTKGQRSLDDLKDFDVPGLPRELAEISFSAGGEHREYTHLGWDETYSDSEDGLEKNWKLRKKILLNTTETVFDFGVMSNRFHHNEKCDSFSAIVYYVHLLGDCVADKEYKGDNNNEKMNAVPVKDGETTGIIAEMRKHFKVLFSDQKDKRTYDNLMSCLDSTEKELERIVNQTGRLNYPETFQDYRKVTKDFLEKDLPDKVPPLFENEQFFKDVFYSTAGGKKSIFPFAASIRNHSTFRNGDQYIGQGESW